MGNRAFTSVNNPNPLILTFNVPRYPSDTLGQRIRKARLERGLYQRDLAKELGVDEMTIVNWERGKTVPRATYCDRIREHLNIVK